MICWRRGSLGAIVENEVSCAWTNDGRMTYRPRQIFCCVHVWAYLRFHKVLNIKRKREHNVLHEKHLTENEEKPKQKKLKTKTFFVTWKGLERWRRWRSQEISFLIDSRNVFCFGLSQLSMFKCLSQASQHNFLTLNMIFLFILIISFRSKFFNSFFFIEASERSKRWRRITPEV